jgi:hypothetical protein
LYDLVLDLERRLSAVAVGSAVQPVSALSVIVAAVQRPIEHSTLGLVSDVRRWRARQTMVSQPVVVWQLMRRSLGQTLELVVAVPVSVQRRRWRQRPVASSSSSVSALEPVARRPIVRHERTAAVSYRPKPDVVVAAVAAEAIESVLVALQRWSDELWLRNRWERG